MRSPILWKKMLNFPQDPQTVGRQLCFHPQPKKVGDRDRLRPFWGLRKYFLFSPRSQEGAGFNQQMRYQTLCQGQGYNILRRRLPVWPLDRTVSQNVRFLAIFVGFWMFSTRKRRFMYSIELRNFLACQGLHLLCSRASGSA